MAATAQDPLAGNFRLGAFPTLATYLFPQLVSQIKQALPRIRLILIEEKTEQLLLQLRSGLIDAALLALPIDEDFLTTATLFEDEFLLAVASDHPLASKAVVEQSDLAGEPLLLLDEGHCLRGQALQVCQNIGAHEEQDFRATSLETLRQMVCAGTGITFMPRIAIREETGIRYQSFLPPAPSRTIGLAWRKTSARIALMNEIARLVRQVAGQ